MILCERIWNDVCKFDSVYFNAVNVEEIETNFRLEHGISTFLDNAYGTIKTKRSNRLRI
jgi:hypothetical protein